MRNDLAPQTAGRRAADCGVQESRRVDVSKSNESNELQREANACEAFVAATDFSCEKNLTR